MELTSPMTPPNVYYDTTVHDDTFYLSAVNDVSTTDSDAVVKLHELWESNVQPENPLDQKLWSIRYVVFLCEARNTYLYSSTVDRCEILEDLSEIKEFLAWADAIPEVMKILREEELVDPDDYAQTVPDSEEDVRSDPEDGEDAEGSENDEEDSEDDEEGSEGEGPGSDSGMDSDTPRFRRNVIKDLSDEELSDSKGEVPTAVSNDTSGQHDDVVSI